MAAPWWTSHKNIPGIYLTVDGGVNYRRLSDMPGEGMAWRLTLDPHDGNRLYVGTNGIGAWRAVIAENGSPDTAGVKMSIKTEPLSSHGDDGSLLRPFRLRGRGVHSDGGSARIATAKSATAVSAAA